MTLAADLPASSSSSKWNIGLWVAAVALALLYAMSVYMKLLMSQSELVAMGLLWVEGAPMALVRAIGAAEMVGVIGLLVPAATRIMPKLSVYAAMGLLAVQLLAIPFHMLRGEFAVLPFNLIYLGLAVLVIWGRTKKAPIAPRA